MSVDLSSHYTPSSSSTSLTEDQISNTNTEDVLLSSGAGSEIDTTTQCCQFDNTKKTSNGFLRYLIPGVIFIILGICSIIWTPFQLLMDERLRMRPGLPPYEWWKNPPDEVIMRAYIFNVTNSEEFLNNPDVKLNIHELAPIIFLEKLIHSNVTFNDNGTLSYVATRKLIYLPEQNTLDLNATVIIPNWAMIGIASYLAEQSFFVKFGYNLLLRTLKPQVFLKLTINDFLWNISDPVLSAARNIAPFLVPINNLGILSRIYEDFENTVTVYVGEEGGNERFFLIDKYDGSEYLPYYGESCSDKVVNSSEGVAYPQFLTKRSVLRYWRRTFCKMAELPFERDENMYGVAAYKYVLKNSSYDRTQPAEHDCYKSQPELLNGLSDVSKCHFDFPIAASFPHFLHGDSNLSAYVTGLSPNNFKHESYVIVEPLTGLPLEGRARSQSNLVVRKLEGFHGMLKKFSNTIIPMFWLEYNQKGLPLHISLVIYIQVNIVPIGQKIFSAALILTGAGLLYIYVRSKSERHLLPNKSMHFEHEAFINKI